MSVRISKFRDFILGNLEYVPQTDIDKVLFS